MYFMLGNFDEFLLYILYVGIWALVVSIFYCLVRADLLWVWIPLFLYGSDTLVLLTQVPHLHYAVIEFPHQRDNLFSLVPLQSDIKFKNYKIVKDVSFLINIDVPGVSLHN